MNRLAAALATMVLSGAVVASGCGLGSGQAASGEADLAVTRDYGAEVLVEAGLEDPRESETVVRFLDREAEIETSYGDNFVDSIDGLAGSTAGGGPEDWFFFVNGYYSEIGAGEAQVTAGDRIWWDYRTWSEAYRVPAVVGSWPQPFVSGYRGERPETAIQCMTEVELCEVVAERLREAGVEPAVESVDAPRPDPNRLRILIGSWESLRLDPAAAQLERGPGVSGVFAELERCTDGWRIAVAGSDSEPRVRIERGGLVAAVRSGDDQPTWVVAGTAEQQIEDAIELLEPETLVNRYAVAADASGDGGPIAVPVAGELPALAGAVC